MKKLIASLIVLTIISCEKSNKKSTVLDNSDSQEITFILELNTKGKQKKKCRRVYTIFI